MRRILLCVALLVATVPPAEAITARTLHGNCVESGRAGDGEAVDWAFCAGFLRGAMDAWRVERELSGEDRFCLPEEGIGMEDALGAFATLYGQAEQTHGMPAAIVLLLALRQAYPCGDG